MVEEPNFEYNYDLAYRKSFAARLSFRIMGVAAGVFLVAVILFFRFTGDSMTLPMTHQIVKYGSIVFVVGLASLFIFCTWAIYQMVRPLRQFTESVISIANGNLDTPLPTIHSEDELLQLPLYLLAERLWHIFSLDAIEGEDVYVLTFLDELQNHLRNAGAPDIQTFLTAWDEKLHMRPVPGSAVERSGVPHRPAALQPLANRERQTGRHPLVQYRHGAL